MPYKPVIFILLIKYDMTSTSEHYLLKLINKMTDYLIIGKKIYT